MNKNFEQKLEQRFQRSAEDINPNADYGNLIDRIEDKDKGWFGKLLPTVQLPSGLKPAPVLWAGTAVVALILGGIFLANSEQQPETITANETDLENTVPNLDTPATTIEASEIVTEDESDVTETSTSEQETEQETEQEATTTTETDAATAEGESTPTEPDEPNTFTETFDTAASRNRFTWQINHFNDFFQTQSEWPQDTCGNQPASVVERGEGENFSDDWFFHCGATGRLFTSIGDTSNYSIGAFSPDQTFEDISEVRWEVNISNLGNRQWTEVALVPANTPLDATPCAIEWISDCPNSHDDIGSIGVTFSNQEMGINLGVAGEELAVDGVDWKSSFPDEQALVPLDPGDTPVLREHYLRQEDGEVVFGIERDDGSFAEISTPGSFPDGPLKVVFSDHNFTPLKSESISPNTFTWHWDNIEIS